MANNEIGRLGVLIIELFGLVFYNPITDSVFWIFYDVLKNVIGENPDPASSLLLVIPWMLFIFLLCVTCVTIISLIGNALK